MKQTFRELLATINPNLEGLQDGVLSKEIEFTFYAHVKDLSELESAPFKEKHEQWKLPIQSDGTKRLRIRRVDDRRATITTKISRTGMVGWEEIDEHIGIPLFDHLKEMSTSGYFKHRYTFPIIGTQLKWEIDVFQNQTGQPHPWVKVDLEVDNLDMKIPELPFEFDDFICENDDNMSSSDRRQIDMLWDTEWQRIDGK